MRGAPDLGFQAPVESATPPSCNGFDADPLGALPATWSVNGGMWHIITDGSHHALEQIETVSARIVAWTTTSSNDVRWSVVVHPRSDLSTVCATVRATDRNRYLLCLKDGTSWTLERDRDGDDDTIDSGSLHYDSSIDHTLVLAVQGNKLTGLLDGVQLTERIDDQLTEGGVGVAANDDSVFTSACTQVP